MSPPPSDDESPTLFDRPTHEILLVLGSLLAIFLGAIFLSVAVLGEEAARRQDALVAGLTNYAIVDVVLGFLLLVSLAVLRRSRTTGALMALVSAILLIVLGGTAGIVGGLFGLVGALIALLPAYKSLLP